MVYLPAGIHPSKY